MQISFHIGRLHQFPPLEEKTPFETYPLSLTLSVTLSDSLERELKCTLKKCYDYIPTQLYEQSITLSNTLSKTLSHLCGGRFGGGIKEVIPCMCCLCSVVCLSATASLKAILKVKPKETPDYLATLWLYFESDFNCLSQIAHPQSCALHCQSLQQAPATEPDHPQVLPPLRYLELMR